MTPAAIIQQARAEGVMLALTPSGTIKASGNGEAVRRWQVTLREHKLGIVAALKEAAKDPAPVGVNRRWLIQFAGRSPVEVIFHPDATRDDALAAFPGSVVATPLPEALDRQATPEQAEELRALVALILRDADDADRAEALAVALADPDAALTSFRVLAAELQTEPLSDRDDRRTCQQCTNLSPDGHCRAAARGELPYVASRKYSPVPDVPKRCEGFRPLGDDLDQRPGGERWPSLSEPSPDPKPGPQ